MNEGFRHPTKRELQARYGIPNDDFDVLVASGEPAGDWIERVADFAGVPTYLRRNAALRIVAVIFFAHVAIHTYVDGVHAIAHDYYNAIEPFRKLPVPKDRDTPYPIVAVTPGIHSNTSEVVTIHITAGASAAGATGPSGPTPV